MWFYWGERTSFRYGLREKLERESIPRACPKPKRKPFPIGTSSRGKLPVQLSEHASKVTRFLGGALIDVLLRSLPSRKLMEGSKYHAAAESDCMDDHPTGSNESPLRRAGQP